MKQAALTGEVMQKLQGRKMSDFVTVNISGKKFPFDLLRELINHILPFVAITT